MDYFILLTIFDYQVKIIKNYYSCFQNTVISVFDDDNFYYNFVNMIGFAYLPIYAYRYFQKYHLLTDKWISKIKTSLTANYHGQLSGWLSS